RNKRWPPTPLVLRYALLDSLFTLPEKDSPSITPHYNGTQTERERKPQGSSLRERGTGVPQRHGIIGEMLLNYHTEAPMRPPRAYKLLILRNKRRILRMTMC